MLYTVASCLKFINSLRNLDNVFYFINLNFLCFICFVLVLFLFFEGGKLVIYPKCKIHTSSHYHVPQCTVRHRNSWYNLVGRCTVPSSFKFLSVQQETTGVEFNIQEGTDEQELGTRERKFSCYAIPRILLPNCTKRDIGSSSQYLG